MESFNEMKHDLGEWVDARIDEAVKTAVAEANKDLTEFIDTRFARVEEGLNDVGITVSGVSKDVGTMMDSVTKLFESVVAIPQRIVDQISHLNPFHLP